MSELMERLRAPFPPDRVSWRVGSTTADKSKGMALAYIDARDVMDRLDDVCGPENWQCDYPHANGKTVCRIGIRIEGSDWVWKADGAGDTDVEAEKGALSDAFKRAAVRWGIGRYLYDLASPWVAIEQRGRSYVIPIAEQQKLAAMLRNTSLSGVPYPPPPPKLSVVATALITSLKMAQSVDDLTKWTADNNSKIARLVESDKQAIREAYAAHRTQLAEAEYKEAAE